MPRTTPKILGCLVALALAVSLASAETAPAPRPAPAAPPASAANTQVALKLAGLVTFVANACPKMQPNYARFEEAIIALGLTKADLDKADIKAGYLGYAARYNTDIKANCERADAQFGPRGTTIDGIFTPR